MQRRFKQVCRFFCWGDSASFQGVFVREKSSILEDSVTNFSWFRADPILITFKGQIF
jgi:hypothetical protein